MSCTLLSSFTFLANEYQHQELIIPPFHNILKTDCEFFKEIFACKQDWRKHGEKLRGVEDALWMLARVFLRKTRELQKSVFFSTPVKQQRKRIDRKTSFALNF